MLRTKRLSGLVLIPEISINIAFNEVDLSTKRLSPGPEKILRTKSLSPKPQKQGWQPHSFKQLRVLKIAKKRIKIVATVTVNNVMSVKKTLF